MATVTAAQQKHFHGPVYQPHGTDIQVMWDQLGYLMLHSATECTVKDCLECHRFGLVKDLLLMPFRADRRAWCLAAKAG